MEINECHFEKNDREVGLKTPEPDGKFVRTVIPSDRMWIVVVHHPGTEL